MECCRSGAGYRDRDCCRGENVTEIGIVVGLDEVTEIGQVVGAGGGYRDREGCRGLRRLQR